MQDCAETLYTGTIPCSEQFKLIKCMVFAEPVTYTLSNRKYTNTESKEMDNTTNHVMGIYNGRQPYRILSKEDQKIRIRLNGGQRTGKNSQFPPWESLF